MRSIVADNNVIGTSKFNNYFTKYVQKKGYKVPYQELPSDILAELSVFAVMSYCALDINIDEEFLIKVIDNKGVEIIDLKALKVGKYALNFDLEYMRKALGVPEDDEMLPILTNPNNWKKLDDTEIFKHPLSEHKEEKIRGEKEILLNSYSVASLFINAVRGLLRDEGEKESTKAETNFKKLILMADSSVPVESLLLRVKAGYVQEMMQFCTLVNSVFERAVEEPHLFDYF